MREENNRKKKKELLELVEASFFKFLEKGKYGSISFRVLIQDGSIQSIEKTETESFK